MAREVEVKGLTIQVGAREIELTVAEAKKLKDALNDLFGKEIVREVVVEKRVYPNWYWSGPIWGGNSPTTVNFEWGKAYCSATGNLSAEVKS